MERTEKVQAILGRVMAASTSATARFRPDDLCDACTLGCSVAFHANPTPLRPLGGCSQRGCGCTRTRDSFSPTPPKSPEILKNARHTPHAKA